jgi:hypothetical protein
VTPQHEESKVGFSSYGLTIETTAGLLARTANRKHRGNVICGKRTGLAKTLTVVKHHRADNKCRRRCIAGVSKRDFGAPGKRAGTLHTDLEAITAFAELSRHAFLRIAENTVK